MSKRAVVRSAAVLIAVYALLSAPWPGLGPAFVRAYAAAVEPLAQRVLASPGTTFRAREKGDAFDDWDLLIRFPVEAGATRVRGVRVQLRRICYAPLALSVALGFALPARRKGKAAAAAVAGVLLAFQIAGILSVFVTRGAMDLGAPVDLLVVLASRALLEAPGITFALPALAWLIVGGQLEALLSRMKPSPHVAPPV